MRGSGVHALGLKGMNGMSNDKIVHLAREQAENNPRFAGFLIFHCPLKEDAIETIHMLNESSHRVQCASFWILFTFLILALQVYYDHG